MKNNRLKDSILEGPGPSTSKEAINLFAKGVAMGTADIIPGVSGGTIAFITGIYSQLLNAIKSVGAESLKSLFKFQIADALKPIHFRFLIPLGLGIMVALLSTARLMSFLLKNHPVPTWSLFFGLILASTVVLGKSIENIASLKNIVMIILGAIAAFLIVGLIPVTTPTSWWFILFCGMIAITAMILPGISGSFILLILGKYEFITGALKNPFSTESIQTIIVFVIGASIGITGFSRVLSYLLMRFRTQTLCILTGLMIGSLRKVWPWKEVLSQKTIRGKIHILSEMNILPAQFEKAEAMALLMLVVGIILVFLLEKMAETK
ncbi:MAG: DUF368 domain-containing protein [Bacteriovoracaceae bacterium]|nr:DUF368 domain-containing protein [Bacteriovoracaceae bacterium]